MTRRTACLLPLVLWAWAAGATSARAQACVDVTGDMCLATVGGGVADIFQTSDGLFAPQLTFGRYLRAVTYPGCAIGETTNKLVLSGVRCVAGPSGGWTPTGDGRCTNAVSEPMTEAYASSLDWRWTAGLRVLDDCTGASGGEPSSYVPWRGHLFDLGAEANRVVIFPISDHGPLPCEAIEYSVWLSNDPDSLEVAPSGSADPRKWNRAVMLRAFLEGWTRNPSARGVADRDRADLATFLRDGSGGDAVVDSITTVWGLPCGLGFRYAAVVAGNDGNPTAACVFHSVDDELDAVAGLNEDDTAICVDADADGHRDAACGGGDCDDTDPSVHPGAFEPCDATRDLNCAPATGCPEGTVCSADTGLCVPRCFEGGCAVGFSCVEGACVEEACAALPAPCPEGTLCRGGACVGPCEGVTCPAGRRCVSGACIDPCAGVTCPTNQVCVAGDPGALTLCGPACTCTELSVPLCSAEQACDERSGSATLGECVPAGCEALSCGPGQVCLDGAAGCTDGCAGVACPRDQVCTTGECVPDVCAGVRCTAGERCTGGVCMDACAGVDCAVGFFCRGGECVADPCSGVDCGAGMRCAGGACVPDGTAVDGGVMDMDAGPPAVAEETGCGCRAAGTRGRPSPAGMLALLWVLVFARRGLGRWRLGRRGLGRRGLGRRGLGRRGLGRRGARRSE